MPQIKTFAKRSGNFRQLAEEHRKKTLTAMAQFAIEVSPVDTAAYVDSFGFNSPQGFSSHGRETGQDAGAAKARNQARVAAEVDALDLSGTAVFGNSAPHAGAVEDRPVQKAPNGYKVFAQTRREFTRIARQALQETKQQ